MSKKNEFGHDEISGVPSFEYLDDKPAKRTETVSVKKEEKTEVVAGPPVKKGSLLDRLVNVFKKNPSAPAEKKSIEVKVEAPVLPQTPPDAPASPAVFSDKMFKWRIPADTKAVKVRVLNENGSLVNEYNISTYIQLKPGQILQVISE